MGGTIDNWCETCAEVRKFEVVDPGSCRCSVCGHVDVMAVPLKPGSGAPR